jgi:parallel beta-helix repeat protein
MNFFDRFQRTGMKKFILAAAAIGMVVSAGVAGSASASPLCVNTTGSGGCYSTIQAAIDAVSAPSITIVVAPGHYTASCGGPACSVAAIAATASNASSLEGLTLRCREVEGSSVRLDATGLDHGVYVSGINNVAIKGCVVRNAQREGILVENSTGDDIAHNEIADNDQAMATTAGTGPAGAPCPTFLPPGSPAPGGGTVLQCCPDAYAGGPGNYPNDNDDCGEGIHLRAVTNSVVQRNLVHDNIGGILMTDETGPNSSNLIAGDTSKDNTAFGGDCGVTLASHVACDTTSTDASGCKGTSDAPHGVFHNQVAGNELEDNGASGVGAFANPGVPPGSATMAYGNLISDNVIKDNGQPGVAIHAHAANGVVDNNIVTENVISDNGGDAEAEGASPPKTGIEVLSNGSFGGPFGPAAPIKGTVISQNSVSKEKIDVWVGNTATDARVFLNDLVGHTGVDNEGSGTAVATDNWWGCPKGPGAPGCSSTVNGSTGTIVSTPFMSHPLSPEK